MKKILLKFSKFENIFFLRVIHLTLTTMIPLIMAGALSFAILSLPVEAYQNFLCRPQLAWFSSVLYCIYYGTYHFFSPALVAVIATSYTMCRNIPLNQTPFFVLAALAGYGSALNIGSDGFSMVSISMEGCFQALIVSFISCQFFYLIQKLPFFHKSRRSTGLEIVCAHAIHMIIPVFFICMFWSAVNQLIYSLWNVYSLHELVYTSIQRIFNNLGTDYFSALLFTFMVHLLWLLGFHGSWMMEPVAATTFSAVGPDILFSKKMFDTFVVMGGCGTTICVLLGILLFSKKKRLRHIAYTASFPVVFNINEILNFGIPIVLNPVLGIPFLLVPIEALTISYAAIVTGLCPPVTTNFAWSTPIFFSGYLATGSLRGALLQLLIIIIGTATYLPFLHINEELHEANLKDQLKLMISEMQEMESANIPINFLNRTDNMGLLAQMLLRDLKTALKEKKLFLLYQPLMDYSGHCIGAEALIRWKHPVFGYIYPPLLIYIAKAGNLLPELETQLFDMSCSAIRKVSSLYDGDFHISVNITAKSLLWNDMEKCICNTIEHYQIPSDKLWLEITEQDVLRNSQNTIDKLQQLKSMGHSLLIDDFGMGHTSLMYLQSNYFDVVKIDGSLTKSILTSETDQKIISSVIDLSKQLNIRVIAEYVETAEEMNKLHELGCNWYQGYLFSPAIPLDDFVSYMKAHS